MTMLEKHAFDEITSVAMLHDGFEAAMKGKGENYEATKLSYHAFSILSVLQKDLRFGHYRPLPYRRSIILEPKVRKIEAPAFRDRIVHHAIHNVLSPFYEKHFIPDSYACRIGRGTHRAMQKVEKIVRASPDVYVCKIDVSKYFPSINHRKLFDIINKHIKDKRLMYLLAQIIHSTDSGTEYDYLFPADSYFHTKGVRGIPIGNLTSQLFANIYLHELDMYAKQKLKIRRYLRYMDDILIFHEDKEELKHLQQKVIEFLYEELYLTVNPRKVRLYPARVGVDFVGFVVWPHKRRVRGSSVRRFRRRFNKHLKRIETDIYNEEAIERIVQSFNSWVTHSMHSKNQKFIDNDRAMLIRAISDWKAKMYALELLDDRKNGIRDENFKLIPKKPVQLSLFDL